MTREEWRTVPGEPRYRVSNLGRVRSLTMRFVDKNGVSRKRVGGLLKQGSDSGGYKTVSLYGGGGSRSTVFVHRMVAMAFLPNPDDLPVVMHLDHNRANNAATNLQWGSQLDNVADKRCPSCNELLHNNVANWETPTYSDEEVWRDVRGHEGRYQVSNHGRVRSIEREIELRHFSGKMMKRAIPGKILGTKARSGRDRRYPIIVLSDQGKYTYKTAHRLVAEHFLRRPHGCDIVMHLDDNPLHNHVDNLRWGTPQENTLDIQCPNCQDYIYQGSYQERMENFNAI